MRRIAPILALVLAATACGDDGGVSLGSTTTTTTTAASTTTVATTTTVAPTTTEAPTTTVAPTTTAAPASRCTGLTGMTLPADAADLIRWPGSFDGDPQPESIMESDGAILFEQGGSYWFGFSLAIPYVVFVELPEPLIDGFVPEITAVRDFGDLDDGVLVKIDVSPLSGHQVYRWYYLDEDCQVEDAATADTNPLDFLVGFGASHREGFTCTGDGVWVTTAGDQGGGLWERLDTFYEWDPAGTGFLFGFTDGFEAPAGDPDIQDAGALDC